ncbi:MAG: hypothetical protein GY749_31615 [Desulfobacteraceae bacterium]|nr:hypothetical protein [Desulfobacteraceae bacterium]
MNEIDSLTIKKPGTQQKLTCNVVLLEEKHLPDMMKLQEIIVNNLEDDTLFNPSSAEFLRQHIEIKGKMLGVFAGNELIAYHSLYFPEPDEADYNMGTDLNLPESEMNKVANFQNLLVHPEFTKSKLGLNMNKYALQLLEGMKYRHIFATVSPFNISSIKIFFDSGFTIRGLKYKYGNKLRYIFYQDYEKSPELGSEPEISVSNTALEEQQQALKQGYCGIGIRKAGKGFEILYGVRSFDY